MHSKFRQMAFGMASAVAIVAAAQSAQAQAGAFYFDIEQQSLGTALMRAGETAGVVVVVPAELVNGRNAKELVGNYTALDAIQRLLGDNGLVARQDASGAYVVSRTASPAAVRPAPASLQERPSPVRTDDEDAVRVFDQIVVTGRAGASDLRKIDTSYAITTLSEETLRLNAPVSTAAVFQNVPGFWVEASGGEASNNVRARGIPLDGFASVSIQEDGLTIQHDGALGWLNADQSFRFDETIGRVEAVRGGPASIFSSNSPGGTVNFITRKAGDTAEGLIKVQIGDYGFYRTDFWYGAPLGNGWGLTLGGFYRSDEGVRSPGFAANDGGQIRVGLSREFANGKIDVNYKRIDDNVGFLLPVPLTFDGDGEPAGVPGFDANYGTFAGPDNRLLQFRNVGGDFDWDLSRGTDVSLNQFTAIAEFEIGAGWKLENRARYRDSDIVRNGLFPTGSIETATGFLATQASAIASVPGATGLRLRYSTSGEAFDVANQNGNGLIIRGNLLSVSVPLTEFTNDLRVVRTFETGSQTHDVAVGAYVSQFDYSYDRYMATSLLEVRDQARRLDVVAVGAAGQNLATLTDNGILRHGSLFDNADVESRVYAFYLSDEWQVTPNLRIDGGLRHERTSIAGAVEGKRTVNLGDPATIADDAITTGTGAFTPIERDFDGTSWTIGANWQFNDDFGIFGRYTDTVRLPSPSEFQGSPGDAVRTDIVNTPIEMFEVGLKLQGENFDLFATAFSSKFDNVRFNDAVFNSVTNQFVTRVGYAGTQTIGVELEGRFQPVDWFDVAGAVSFQEPEFENFVFTENVGGQPVSRRFDGNQLIRVPKTQARITPGFNLLGDRIRLQVPVEYYSDRFADAANSVKLPAYTVFNLDARFDLTETLSLSLNGTNITNEIGLTEGNPRASQFISGEAGARYFLARPILGQAWRVGATYRF